LLPTDEPSTAEAIRDFKLQARAANDHFAGVLKASDGHRQEHGYDTFPTGAAQLGGDSRRTTWHIYMVIPAVTSESWNACCAHVPR